MNTSAHLDMYSGNRDHHITENMEGRSVVVVKTVMIRIS
jgi:hypothetical protein